MTERKTEHAGLSPSSFTLYQACPRKYAHKKVFKTEVDKDFVEDNTNFNVGKAFHQACEDTRHFEDPLASEHLKGIISLYELSPEWYYPIKAMLNKYREVHVKSKLEVVACEVELENPTFYGFVDVVLREAGGWWIGDLKTAASFTDAQVNLLLGHPQLNLYAAHAPLLARKLGLDVKEFKGCRYRVTTKSKLKMSSRETPEEYLARLESSIRSYDFILPIEKMNHREVYKSHMEAFKVVSKKAEGFYPQNFSNCFSYYRPCEFYSKCTKRTFSESGGLDVISS